MMPSATTTAIGKIKATETTQTSLLTLLTFLSLCHNWFLLSRKPILLCHK
jgi:hypothetical protein